jgi:hypothetical protein
LVSVAWAASLCLSPGTFGVPMAAQQPPGAGAVELRPGVVIDATRRIAYVMNPRGGIDAVRLARGQLVWHSNEAAHPLAAAGGVLVAQVEVPNAGNELRLRTLDASSGRTRRAMTHVLPGGTRATVVGTAEGAFLVQATATPTEATLLWEFEAGPLQGVRPGALDVDAPPDARAAASVQQQPLQAQSAIQPASGVVRIELQSGRTSAAPQDQKVAMTARTLEAAPEVRIAAVTGQQFVSADGRHVLASERIGDDSVWDRYRWTVFERGTGRRVGAVTDYRSHAPFIVDGDVIYYETGPFERRTDAGMVSEPLRLRAVNLSTSAVVWTRDIRDTTYRGPLPG